MTKGPEAGWARETPFDSPMYLERAEVPAGGAGSAPPVALFLAGGPATGKVTVLDQLGASGSDLIPSDPVRVMPKEIRRMLPEFDQRLEAGMADAAEYVFEETLDLAAMIVSRAVAAKHSLALYGMGDLAPTVFSSQLERFQAAGYEVRVLLVDAPISLAQDRAVERAGQTHLWLDPDEIHALHVRVSRRFLEWKDVSGLRMEMYSTAEER